jgi:excisionase family DNA binding protein
MVDDDKTGWTLEQAAKVLGKSVRTIRRMIQDGALNGYKIAGQRGAEWRIEPVKISVSESAKVPSSPEIQDEVKEAPELFVSESSKVPAGLDSVDENDRLCQLLNDSNHKIESFVIRTGHLEALLSERDQELNQLTARVEQSDRELVEMQVTFEFTNKQLAQMSERIHIAEECRVLANNEREAAVREAAELKEQVKALKIEVSGLISKLAEPSAQPPLTGAEEKKRDSVSLEPLKVQDKSSVLKSPVCPPGSAEKTHLLKISLIVVAKYPMQCPLGQVALACENIEREVLSRFGMKKLSDQKEAWVCSGEYELVLLQADDACLGKQIQEICQQCQQEAGKLKCIAKFEVRS